jgi:hypothetical protein
MITRIDGLDELNAYLKNVPPEAKDAVNHELKLIAADLQGKAQRLAPVDTGDLRGSAFSEVIGMDATVGFTEPYALRQHEELDYAHPRGGQAKYLETPYKENVKKYADDIGDAVKGATER